MRMANDDCQVADMQARRGPPAGGPLDCLTAGLLAAQVQPPDALRVRGRVEHGRAGLLPEADAGRDTGRRLDLEVRDLEPRQALRHEPAVGAVLVAAED